MNYEVRITTDESSRRYLKDKLDWLLDLMDKEHHHCSTHSQRNMYQAVIRHELEIMRDELRYADIAHPEPQRAEGDQPQPAGDQIPF